MDFSHPLLEFVTIISFFGGGFTVCKLEILNAMVFGYIGGFINYQGVVL